MYIPDDMCCADFEVQTQSQSYFLIAFAIQQQSLFDIIHCHHSMLYTALAIISKFDWLERKTI
jgi:hypothetical protein